KNSKIWEEFVSLNSGGNQKTICESISYGLRNHPLLVHYNEIKNQLSLIIFTSKDNIIKCTGYCGKFGNILPIFEESKWLIKGGITGEGGNLQHIRKSGIILDRSF